MGLGTRRTPLSTSHLPPAPRETTNARDIWVSLSVAVVLGVAATIIALWPNEQDAKTMPQSSAPTLSMVHSISESPPQTDPSEAQNLPTLFANPFDASEVFEFPPGTTEDAARESVAETLLQRARERRAQISKHAHGHQSASLRTPTLVSQSIFKKTS